MTRRGLGLMALLHSVLVVAVGGCERKFTFVPVEGTVTKNGRPLRNVNVVFLADPDTDTLGPRATGTTDEAGRYRLRADKGEDGAVPGAHRVLVLDLDVARQQFLRSMRGKDAPPATPEAAKRLEGELKKQAASPRVPPKYGSIPETPLRARVGAEPLVFDITIP